MIEIIAIIIAVVLFFLLKNNSKISYHEALFKLSDNYNRLLYQGCYNGSFPILDDCRNEEADINELDENYWTPLMKSIIFCYTLDSKYEKIMKLLVEYGADLNPTTPLGITPLMVASAPRILIFSTNSANQGIPVAICSSKTYTTCSEILTFLLSKGANVNMKNKEGNTALHLAATEGNYLGLQILIDAGADISIKNKSGETALDMFKSVQNELSESYSLGPTKKLSTSEYDKICKILQRKKKNPSR